MRRSHLAILSLLSLFTVASGCRQTTNGINGSPLTPISPLAPNNSLFPAPGSGIGPMGGSTRVPPPSTGSVGTPSSYLGGATGQVSDQNGYNGFAAAPNTNAVIGSGVQSAGWSETTANVPGGPVAPAGFNDDGRPLYLQDSSAQSDISSRPRLGGMPVIDLTQSPAPPGYRSQQPVTQFQGGQYQAAPNVSPAGSYNMSPYPSNVGYGVPGSYAGASVTANGTFSQQNYGAPPTYDVSQNYNNSQSVPAYRAITELPPPTLQLAPQPQTGFATAQPNRSFENVGNGFQSSQPTARTLPGTQAGPSTEPAERTANAPQDDLLWRRPGSRF